MDGAYHALGGPRWRRNPARYSAGKVAKRSARLRSGEDFAVSVAGSAPAERAAAKTTDTSVVGLAATASSRSPATAKLSADRILGPVPGRRTVSDERIREAVPRCHPGALRPAPVPEPAPGAASSATPVTARASSSTARSIPSIGRYSTRWCSVSTPAASSPAAPSRRRSGRGIVNLVAGRLAGAGWAG